jgi:hypothetical protein
MMDLQLVGAAAAVVSSVALGLRANMLKPKTVAWFTAPTAVWLPMGLHSILLLALALALFRGALALPALVILVFVFQAISNLTLLWNLARQAPRSPEGGQGFPDPAG